MLLGPALKYKVFSYQYFQKIKFRWLILKAYFRPEAENLDSRKCLSSTICRHILLFFKVSLCRGSEQGLEVTGRDRTPRICPKQSIKQACAFKPYPQTRQNSAGDQELFKRRPKDHRKNEGHAACQRHPHQAPDLFFPKRSFSSNHTCQDLSTYFLRIVSHVHTTR